MDEGLIDARSSPSDLDDVVCAERVTALRFSNNPIDQLLHLIMREKQKYVVSVIVGDMEVTHLSKNENFLHHWIAAFPKCTMLGIL